MYTDDPQRDTNIPYNEDSMRMTEFQDPFIRVLNHLENTLTASHIAAFPVLCWSPAYDVAKVREEIAKDCLDFSHVPIRDSNGHIRRIACREDLNEKHGVLEEHALPLEERHIVDASRPLRDTLLLLRHHRVLLVRSPESGYPDGISGIINHADIQKTPVRLLLFAQITEIEVRLRNRATCESWEEDPDCAAFVKLAEEIRRRWKDPEGRLPLINYLNLNRLMCLTRTRLPTFLGEIECCEFLNCAEKLTALRNAIAHTDDIGCCEFLKCAEKLTAIRNDVAHSNDIGCRCGANPLDTIDAVNNAFDLVGNILADVRRLGQTT